MSEGHHRRLGAAFAVAAGAGLPALLREVSMVPAPAVHGLVIAAAAAAALGAPDPARLRWRRWLLDLVLVGTVLASLTLLWAVRHPQRAPGPATLHALALLLLGAAAEELVYRGWLPALIAEATPMRAAPALLSTIAFSLAHPAVALEVGSLDGGALGGHAAAGALFYALRGSDGSLVAPMLAHVAYNAAVRLA